ncbi:hypothetical protein GCM10010266_59040 [Streptomyces griseomycini]|uniref:MmyB-like transcription regulator ligand binding domain-containing protein n=1 Tax=Streptomyces griseomycini TaxID=66895 RepID=A0A7W7LZG1_9ACTN|nr:hypothetical protein [Streptomyces griseomycini]GGQ27955.1 hypothetical protein GCM10010266_59040 [Streptomyces griseomycini]GGR35515.1 hypothetical protein GCM10015536_46500 [Streptomyces griseomycini]
MTCGEDAQGEHQGQPRGQPQREHRRQRRADDRPDGEDGDQKPGLGDAGLQVSRDLGQQAGHDELGGAHQERAQREHAHDERKPGGRCPLRLLDSITVSAAFVRNGRPDVVATNPLARALRAPMFDSATTDKRGRANFARCHFLDPGSQDFFVDWEAGATATVALLRAEAGA